VKKDDRLYARFDIAMDEHPKIMLLSDAAFRALMEATFYARRQMTDGFLDERVAVRKWGQAVIDELASNHDERPTLERVEGGWKIRDYEEHQVTRHDIERKREAGRAGGLAKAKQSASKPVARASESQNETASTRVANGYESLAKKEKEKEKEKEEIKSISTPTARGTRLSDSWLPSSELIEWARVERTDIDPVKEADAFRDYWLSQPAQRGVKLDWDRTFKNWIRNARGRGGQPSKPSQSDKFHATLQMGRDLQAQLDAQALAGSTLREIA
jgi:hypothetical protein